MNAIKSGLLMGLALCVAATSGLARETSSKSGRAERSSAKHRSAASKSRKSKAHKKEVRANRGSETERLLREAPDLPPEDLPEPESDDGEPQLR